MSNELKSVFKPNQEIFVLFTCFYQNFKPLLTPILAELFNNFFFQDNIPKNFKQGIMTLIFKNIGSPDEIKNWRPISLLNIDYKILTMRLKNNITHMINDFQSCRPNKTINNDAQNLTPIIDYIDQNDQNYA